MFKNMTSPSRIPRLLTYAGAIPFYGLAFAYILLPQIAFFFTALLLYSALIVSFICGTHWAACVIEDETLRGRLKWIVVASNLITLAAFALILFWSSFGIWATAVFALLFALLYGLDVLLHKDDIWPDWYITMRRYITYAVILSYVPLWACYFLFIK